MLVIQMRNTFLCHRELMAFPYYVKIVTLLRFPSLCFHAWSTTVILSHAIPNRFTLLVVTGNNYIYLHNTMNKCKMCQFKKKFHLSIILICIYNKTINYKLLCSNKIGCYIKRTRYIRSFKVINLILRN